MPKRKVPLETDEFYHLINKGILGNPIFIEKDDYNRFLDTLEYYQKENTVVSFSNLTRLDSKTYKSIMEATKDQRNTVNIIVYCLMPNHFHLLVKQNLEKGVLRFMSLILNSYARYFNAKYKKKGKVFEGRFKAVHINNENYFLHLTRYIHLNPYSANIVKSFDELLDYKYSSLPEYLGKTKSNLCDKSINESNFKSISSYKDFIKNRADYQRSLQIIKKQETEF